MAAFTVLDSLTFALRDGKALLVLDNFEQVLPTAEFTGELLDACPSCACSSPAASVLGHRGEHVVDIRRSRCLRRIAQGAAANPLHLEASRLFADQAQALDPEFTLTGENVHHPGHLPAAGWLASGHRTGSGRTSCSRRSGACWPSSTCAWRCRAQNPSAHPRANAACETLCQDAHRAAGDA